MLQRDRKILLLAGAKRGIGLFDQAVVNAVLVLILASVVGATLIVDRVKTDVPVPKADRHGLGQRVLVALEELAQAQTGFAIAAGIAHRRAA